MIPLSQARRQQLLICLRTCVLIPSGRGHFTLASGAQSRLFIDCSKLLTSPGVVLVGQALLEQVSLLKLPLTTVGGPGMGAAPLVSVFLAEAAREPITPALRGFLVRPPDTNKPNRERIDGHLYPGDNVLLFDDVLSTGGTLSDAEREVNRRGGKVLGAVVLVDRRTSMPEGTMMVDLDFPVWPLFGSDDLLPERNR